MLRSRRFCFERAELMLEPTGIWLIQVRQAWRSRRCSGFEDEFQKQEINRNPNGGRNEIQ